MSNKNLPKKLRVMADYSSSGIWVIDPGKFAPWRHGMISYEVFGLPEELSIRFSDWIKIYDKNLSNEGLDKDFDKIGLQLARELKKFLGQDVYIEYEPQKSSFGKDMEKVLEREISKKLRNFKGSEEEYQSAYSQAQDKVMSDPEVRKELEKLKAKLSEIIVLK